MIGETGRIDIGVAVTQIDDSIKRFLDASAALHILFAAQFGDHAFEGGVDELPPVFLITKRPIWEPEELYLPPIEEKLVQEYIDVAGKPKCPTCNSLPCNCTFFSK